MLFVQCNWKQRQIWLLMQSNMSPQRHSHGAVTQTNKTAVAVQKKEPIITNNFMAFSLALRHLPSCRCLWSAAPLLTRRFVTRCHIRVVPNSWWVTFLLALATAVACTWNRKQDFHCSERIICGIIAACSRRRWFVLLLLLTASRAGNILWRCWNHEEILSINHQKGLYWKCIRLNIFCLPSYPFLTHLQHHLASYSVISQLLRAKHVKRWAFVVKGTWALFTKSRFNSAASSTVRDPDGGRSQRDHELGLFERGSWVKLIIVSDNESRAPQG